MRCGIDEYVDKLTAELTKKVGSPAAAALLKQINKVDKRTVDINGLKIDYYSVSEGGIQNLAVNTSEGIFLQKDVTAAKAIEYLNGESVDSKLRNTLEVKKKVDDALYSEYGVRLENLLKAMDNNQIRKFLLLHEHRHNMQVAQRKSRQEFMKEYKEDPVRFEYDANKFALVQLGKIDKKIAEKQSANISSRKNSGTKVFTNHTGGAYGADSIWASMFREKGVINNHYRPINDKGTAKTKELYKLGDKIIQITPEEAKAGFKLNSNLGNTTHDMNNRNYVQVANADTILAVAPIVKGKVTGGTGSAVRMAEHLGKDVYVLDIETVKWYKSEGGKYVKVDNVPSITNNFAAIGTRGIESYSTKSKTGDWVKTDLHKNTKAVLELMQYTVDSNFNNKQKTASINAKVDVVYTKAQELAKAKETISKNKPFYKHYVEDKELGTTVYPHTMLNGKTIYVPAAGVGYYYVGGVKKQVLPGIPDVSMLGRLKAAVETEVANQEGKTITTSDGKVSKNPDIEYLTTYLNWAKEEIQVPASDGYKFMIQGIMERAEEGLAKTEGLPEFVDQFKKDIADVNKKRVESVTAYFDHILGGKTGKSSNVKQAQANSKEDIITETALDAIPDEGC